MITIEFSNPSVPNFINCHRGNTPIVLPIGDLTSEEVEAYAELFKQAILDNWKNKNTTNEATR